MAEITITPSDRNWVVRATGAILADTVAGLELREGGAPAVIYIPRDDVAMALLERSPTTSTCPHKGVATYYSLHGPAGVVPDVAWSYETPKGQVAAVAGHLAFYPDRVTMERA